MTSNILMSDVEQTPESAGLIDRAVGGSREAFAELLRQHQEGVRIFLRRFVQSADDADDLAQETFLSAFRDIGSYDFSAPLGAWLMGIARHRALHHLRSELRRRQRENNAMQIAIAEARIQQVEESNPEQSALETAALRDCLKELPANSRRLIDEFYFAGRTAAEIAGDRNMKDSAVRMALLRIRRALSDCVQRKTNEPEPGA